MLAVYGYPPTTTMKTTTACTSTGRTNPVTAENILRMLRR